MAAECKHQVAQAAAADSLHCHHVKLRAMHAWIDGISIFWKEKQCKAQRNTLFYRWHERARAKRVVPSRLRARFRLKACGWANEVREQPECSVCCACDHLSLCPKQICRLVNTRPFPISNHMPTSMHALLLCLVGAVSCSQAQETVCSCLESPMASCLAAPQACTATQGACRISGSCC